MGEQKGKKEGGRQRREREQINPDAHSPLVMSEMLIPPGELLPCLLQL